MKNNFRYIVLFPFSILYGIITFIRNRLYDFGWLKSYLPSVPTILVGNLAVGGTGKTPHVEYIVELLRSKYKVAILSRGYKRKTKGFILANDECNSVVIGDEPYQMYRKFKDIFVAVAENRVEGVERLLKIQKGPEVIILDDAYQHRAINPGFKIVLTDYSNLFVDDSMLPGGNLREYGRGVNRAECVIVTKCPSQMTSNDIRIVEDKLALNSRQKLYFSAIQYAEIKPVFTSNIEECAYNDFNGKHILLVTGIVTTKPLETFLKNSGANIELLSFPDHHIFSSDNYAKIEHVFLSLQSDDKFILFTEKDAARIVKDKYFPDKLKVHCFYIPISVYILQNKKIDFEKQILNYVETYTGNS